MGEPAVFVVVEGEVKDVGVEDGEPVHSGNSMWATGVGGGDLVTGRHEGDVARAMASASSRITEPTLGRMPAAVAQCTYSVGTP